MFRLDVLQNQWLILALIGGSALVLTFILAYLAIWRQREGDGLGTVEHANEAQGVWAWLRSFVPWVLIVIVVALFVWGVAYVIWAGANPPNW